MSGNSSLISNHRRLLDSRLDELRATASYRAYERVRDWLLRMQDLNDGTGAGGDTPSAYWREELAGFEYLLDASPLVIEKLRHHTYHITGLRPYEYRSNQDRGRSRLAKKLAALQEVAGRTDLLVPEHPALGGFGHEIDGHRYNIDTLKFFEVLIALEAGAVLSEFREATERRLVWEIGAGWGGFPYQFKTLFPNVTYVITDLPPVFLFSVTYLATMFPSARMRFLGDVPDDRLFDGWQDLDFIFVPSDFHDRATPPRLDLTVNMVSFQEMTTAQVTAYVRRAYELGCPFLYNLNRDRSPHNRELTGVWEIVDRYYWSREQRPLPVTYQRMLDEPSGPPEREYKHVIGWRRVTIG